MDHPQQVYSALYWVLGSLPPNHVVSFASRINPEIKEIGRRLELIVGAWEMNLDKAYKSIGKPGDKPKFENRSKLREVVLDTPLKIIDELISEFEKVGKKYGTELKYTLTELRKLRAEIKALPKFFNQAGRLVSKDKRSQLWWQK